MNKIKQEQLDKAWKEYQAITNPAWETYEAIVNPAREAFDAINHPAREAYEVINKPAFAAYEAKVAEIEAQPETVITVKGNKYKLIKEDK